MPKRNLSEQLSLAVLSNRDIVEHVLAGNVGPAGLASAACVCRVWRDVVDSSVCVLYGTLDCVGGSVTKTAFTRLSALYGPSVDSLQCERRMSFRGSNHEYYLYGTSALHRAIEKNGGMAGWRERRRERRRRPYGQLFYSPPEPSVVGLRAEARTKELKNLLESERRARLWIKRGILP